jgi:hypothetical protein
MLLSSGLDPNKSSTASTHEALPYGERDANIARLQAAAKKKYERDFIIAMRSVDWKTRPPEDFLKAIQLALEVGAYDAASRLSNLGAELHAGEPRLAKYAHALAPAKRRSRRTSKDSSIRANRDWMKAHGEEHRGRWVALRNGMLVGSAASFGDLVKEVGRSKDILITKVY